MSEYESEMTCPCGASVTFRDQFGFLIGGWIREWTVAHAPCRVAASAPPPADPEPSADSGNASKGDE